MHNKHFIGPFKKGLLHQIEIPFHIGSPPNKNGAKLFTTIVRHSNLFFFVHN